MRILVSMRMVENTTYPETRDCLAQDWNAFFTRFRILPILIPNTLTEPEQYYDLDPKGLLLTGGDNRGEPDSQTARDRTEERLLSRALEKRLPVLGVCRGLQTINSHFGGRIERHLSEPHVGPHFVTLDDGSVARVNSFHNNAVMQSGLASPLTVFAATKGGVVEGLRHRDLPVTAVQWHPERLSHSPDLDQKLVMDWLSKCA